VRFSTLRVSFLLSIKKIKEMKRNAVLIALFCLVLQVADAQKALILKKYTVEYAVKNAGIKSTGRFDNVSAVVKFDENNPSASSISAIIQAASFNSGIAMRDKHLKAKDYFDVATFPNITLVSTQIQKSANGYVGTFNLTIKGTTKSVQLPFTVTNNGNDLDFKATELSIDRTTYGVGGSSLTLSNTVKITLNATFSR
jgi:polyisoprenoid-binding protein YceI